MSNRIFTRSPYWVSIAGSPNDVCRVDLYIWNGTVGSSAPATPTRVLQKPIPTSDVATCVFNISPFLREYISFDYEPLNYNTLDYIDTAEFCNVIVKKYLNGVLSTTTTYVCLDGYTEYAFGYNDSLNDFFLDEGTYYYYYDSTGAISDLNKRTGTINLNNGTGWTVKYTDLVNASTYTATPITNNDLLSFPRVYSTYWVHGNKLEIINGSSVVQATYYFRPQEEGKYPVQYLDFINRYGVWQKVFLFKASKASITSIGGTDYTKNSESVNYVTSAAQKGDMNVNGTKSIKCNTGWVSEDFSDLMQQLLLSERILLNAEPVKLKTKSIDKHTHLIDKLINYTIEFEYAFDMVNNLM